MHQSMEDDSHIIRSSLEAAAHAHRRREATFTLFSGVVLNAHRSEGVASLEAACGGLVQAEKLVNKVENLDIEHDEEPLWLQDVRALLARVPELPEGFSAPVVVEKATSSVPPVPPFHAPPFATLNAEEE